MGHTRLGHVPKTKRFSRLIGEFSGNGGAETGMRSAASESKVAEIAGLTLDAASGWLKNAKNDQTLR